MTRRTIAILILAAWLGTLGWLAERHYLGASTAGGESRWPVPPGTAFQTIRFGSRQYGFASLSVDTLAEGLRVTELLTLELPRQQPDLPRRTSYRIEALYSRGLRLLRWQTALLTEAGRSTSTGVANSDSLLTVVRDAPGERAETTLVRATRPVILPNAIPLVAASRGLPRPGNKLNLEIYDPLDNEVRTEHVLVAAESLFTIPDSAEYITALRRWSAVHSDTVRAWRLDAIVHGLPVSRWVDAAGMIVRLEYPLGARLDGTAFELANSNFRALPAAPWDTGATAPSYTMMDGRETGGPTLTVVGRLAPDEALPTLVPALSGGWQDRTGDTLHVGPEQFPDSGSNPLEATSSPPPPDSSVLDRVAHILRAGMPPDAAARRLTDWVRRAITPRPGMVVRSPAQVLADRRGTAQERVTLLVALARGAGLEARTVWGLARIGHRWELRPWAEVRTSRWTPADPAAPATPLAGRVRLATGGEARLLDLALRTGRLRLAVLEETR
jgi:hypothetical protein